MEGIITIIVDFFVKIIDTLGYPGIILGMALESSLIPFPSEIILPPAGVLIARGVFNPYLVFLMALLGSLLGALINYFLALHLGRRFFNKWTNKFGKFLFLNKDHLEKSENYFKNHGEITTFTGRLIPGIRQIISLPAGFAKMKLSRFVFFTAIGSGIWSAILIYLGYFYGENEQSLGSIINSTTFVILGTILVVLLIYIVNHKRKKSKRI